MYAFLLKLLPLKTYILEYARVLSNFVKRWAMSLAILGIQMQPQLARDPAKFQNSFTTW